MQYLVHGTGGPGFATPAETLAVLENGIIPTFEHIMKLEANGRIVAGGLPVGDRSFAFVVEAASNEDVDEVLRDIPAWGVLDWTVTPLQSVRARADKERGVAEALRSAL